VRLLIEKAQLEEKSQIEELKKQAEQDRKEIITKVENNTILVILQDLETNIVRRQIELDILTAMHKNYAELLEKNK
jgi:hypothetical protein